MKRVLWAADVWQWFEEIASVERLSVAELSADRNHQGLIGPHELVADEWLVRLTAEATRSLRSVSDLNGMLDQDWVDFTFLSGLGSPGLVLVRSEAVTQGDARLTLESHEAVEHFSVNSLIVGQSEPNDPDFQGQLLPSLERIDAPRAWETTIGSPSVVVGVVDGGMDVTHPDLYLNVWLNQGEIPDPLRQNLTDLDGDGLITFYDLNNLRRTESGLVVATTDVAATAEELTTATPFGSGLNAPFVSDINGNGRIDAIDLVDDVDWADGRDTDGNTFFDDLFGVNFRRGDDEPFPINRPLDELGHGTHVAGAIGAVGDNQFGVVGVNWQTSLMPLRILDNNNRSDAAAAIRALNYASQMRASLELDDQGRTERGANVRVLNNSWGQPGGFERNFEIAIEELGEQEVLFIAAAGNGNVLGVGVDNDRTPFFPASYEPDNVIAVAAFGTENRLASFSNFGAHSVDIAAPGVNVRSTLPGGAFGPANGTSMATPRVSGTAALIWSTLPDATVGEVKDAILQSAVGFPAGANLVAAGGVLNTGDAIREDVFAPTAQLIAKENIVTGGGTSTEFTVRYSHPNGIDVSTIGDDDLVVSRSWGPDTSVAPRLTTGEVISKATTAEATYVFDAPGDGEFFSDAAETSIETILFDSRFESASDVPISFEESCINPSPLFPDECPGGTSFVFESPIEVSGAFQEPDERFFLTIDLEHDDLEDLFVTLVPPAGSSKPLIGSGNITGTRLQGTVFASDSTDLIASGDPPYTGSFRSNTGGLPPLPEFNTSDINDTWILRISSPTEPQNNGTLFGWSLNFRGQKPVIERVRSDVLVEDLSDTIGHFSVGLDTAIAGRDVTVRLTSPNGATSVLFAGDQELTQFSDTILADDAATPVGSASSPFDGSFRPLEPVSPLGENGPNGIWTLEVEREFDGQDLGLDWSLVFDGRWDPLDFGDYMISTVAGNVQAADQGRAIESREIGSFNVRIEDDPSVLYVESETDSLASESLRGAVIAANAAAPTPMTIILDSGDYELSIPHVADPESTFPDPPSGQFCSAGTQLTGWSGPTSGDLDITGSVTIVGNRNDRTTVDGNSIDRVFKVHPGASLDLSRITVTGGSSPADQGGGGILSAGQLHVDNAQIRDNNALGVDLENPARGGGVAIWDGSFRINRTWLDGNEADFGAGVFVCGDASGMITRATISHSVGGGLHSHSDGEVNVSDSTFSSNAGGLGDIFNGKKDGLDIANGDSGSASISGDGRFVAFVSQASNLVPGDFNNRQDVFVHDRQQDTIERVSVSDSGVPGNETSFSPSISHDGRYVAFISSATNLVLGDNNEADDVFVFDRLSRTIRRLMGVGDSEPNGPSSSPSISDDGQVVAFVSEANNFVENDQNDFADVFLQDLSTGQSMRASVSITGEANGESGSPDLSGDGNVVAFESAASNLVGSDTNELVDIFAFDKTTGMIDRVSVNTAGDEGDEESLAPSISRDGQIVAFHSDATNFTLNDTLNPDIFVFDREDRVLDRITESSNVTFGIDSGKNARVSSDGQLVAYQNTGALFTNANAVFLFDRQANVTTTFDVGVMTEPAAFISNAETGGTIAFQTTVADLSPADTNGVSDVFLVDIQEGETSAITLTPASSQLEVIRTTVAESTDTIFTVDGRVSLADVLLANTTAFINDSRVAISNAIEPGDVGSELIGPLNDKFPPVHPLFLGNPAIDAGDETFSGRTRDALGTLRVDPDIGSFEVVTADAAGRIFVDRDRNQVLGDVEAGIPDIIVTAIGSSGARRDTTTIANDPDTIQIDEAGLFSFAELPTDDYMFELVLPFGWSFSSPELVRIPADQPFRPSYAPTLSADGGLIAFHSDDATILPGDSDQTADAFVYDRGTNTTRRVSINDDGTESRFAATKPVVNADGSLVTFFTDGQLTEPSGLTNVNDDGVFRFDLQVSTVTRIASPLGGFEDDFVSDASGQILISTGKSSFSSDSPRAVFLLGSRSIFDLDVLSVNNDGESANDDAEFPSVSGDGRFVSYQSVATNLANDDTNGVQDIFVFDRTLRRVERVSVDSDGTEANDASSASAISGNGRYIAYQSLATNLVSGDTNDVSDIFVFDRLSETTERISISGTGQQADGASSNPSISSDGRFVVYGSVASNLVENDDNGVVDVFVHDRRDGVTARLTQNRDGDEANMSSSAPFISSDGRFVAFESKASNLVANDTNAVQDIFIVPNPVIEPGATRTLVAGDKVEGITIGIVPDPGQISGVLFQDTVSNGALDLGEPRLANWNVFLDENSNQLFDPGERAVVSNELGEYRFDNVEAFRDYAVAVEVPPGFAQIVPGKEQSFASKFFLPAGGNISGRDFAFLQIEGSGQARQSSVAGRVYQDVNEDSEFTAGVDIPLTDTIVYLDIDNFGNRDANEPAVETDDQGRYEIRDLGQGVVAITTIFTEPTIHTTPLGNEFQETKTPLFQEIQAFTRPQAIAASDLNQDGFPDIVIAQSEGDRLSLRLNDGAGGFLPTEIEVDLSADGGGPIALAVGQFDGPDTPLDVAVANNFGSSVTVLTGFNGNGFEGKQTISVGVEPLDIVAAPFSGDPNRLDLVVVNQADNTIQFLRNLGDGSFQAGNPIDTGGVAPAAIGPGEFTGDANLDIVVAHSAPSSAQSPSGNVRVLVGDGAGNFNLSPEIVDVGVTPIDLIVANFDGDAAGRDDIAVSNIGSTSISILTGNGDGALTRQPHELGTQVGALDIATTDVEGDGDMDIIASDPRLATFSVFRNETIPGGTVLFQPLEGVGQSEFDLPQRVPFVVDDFDQVATGPSGQMTPDIVAVQSDINSLRMLTNSIVDGYRRVQLTGTNETRDLDILVRPATVLPSIAEIPDPIPMDEDDGPQNLELEGIVKGRENGPPLRFEATSSDELIVPHPTISHNAGASTATLTYESVENAVGTANILVAVIDAGADGIFDTGDDAVMTRSFDIRIEPVNDAPVFTLAKTHFNVSPTEGMVIIDPFLIGVSPGGGQDEAGQDFFPFVLSNDEGLFASQPMIDENGRLLLDPIDDATGSALVTITLRDTGGTQNGGDDDSSHSIVVDFDQTTIVLPGDGQRLSLRQPDVVLDGVVLIDIRGNGDNVLELDIDRIEATFGNDLTVISNRGDAIVFDQGWEYANQAFVDDGQLVRRFRNRDSHIDFIGPSDFQNPLGRFDVGGDGEVTSLDALQVINELGRQRFSDQHADPRGQIRNTSEIAAIVNQFRFYDVNADDKITALDALLVINQLGRLANVGDGESIMFGFTADRSDTYGQREISFRALEHSTEPSHPSLIRHTGEIFEVDASHNLPAPITSSSASSAKHDEAQLSPNRVDAAFDEQMSNWLDTSLRQ